MNIEELLPFYALDALSDEERNFVKAHLANYPELESELSDMLATAAQLPESVEPIVPPAEIKRSLMTRISTDSRAVKQEAVSTKADLATNKKSFWENAGFRPFQTALTAVGFALAALVLAYSLNLQREIRQLRLQTAEQTIEITQQQNTLTEREITLAEARQQLEIREGSLAALEQNLQANETALFEAQEQLSLSEGTLDDLQEELAELQADNARLIGVKQELERQIVEDDLLLAVYTAPNWTTNGIAGTEFDADAKGHLVHNPDENQAVLSISNLESLSAEMTYQFWLIGADGPVSAGTFEHDTEGNAVYIFDLHTLSDISAIGVSIEPLGGSEQPTGNIVMLGEVN